MPCAADTEVHPPLRSIRSVEEVAVEGEDVDDGVRRRERRRREVEAARVRVDLRRADVLDALGQRDQRGVAGRRGVGVADDGYDRVEVHARGCTSESLCPCSDADNIVGQPRRVSGCAGEDVSTRLTSDQCVAVCVFRT